MIFVQPEQMAETPEWFLSSWSRWQKPPEWFLSSWSRRQNWSHLEMRGLRVYNCEDGYHGQLMLILLWNTKCQGKRERNGRLGKKAKTCKAPVRRRLTATSWYRREGPFSRVVEAAGEGSLRKPLYTFPNPPSPRNNNWSKSWVAALSSSNVKALSEPSSCCCRNSSTSFL